MHRKHVVLLGVGGLTVAAALFLVGAGASWAGSVQRVRMGENAWVERLHEGGRVEFVREKRDAGHGALRHEVSGRIQGAGVLDAAAVRQLEGRVQHGLREVRRQRALLPSKALGPAELAAQEAEIETCIQMGLAALDLLSKNRYFTVGQMEGYPPQNRDLVYWRFGSVAEVEGKTVDAIFPLRLSEYPELKAAMQSEAAVTRLEHEGHIEDFNGRKLGERQRRIEENDSVRAELRGLYAEHAGRMNEWLASGDRRKMPPALRKLGRRIHALEEKMLPLWMGVDHKTMLVHLRRRGK